MTSIADLIQHERHHTVEETRYWCNQYKIAALALERERDVAQMAAAQAIQAIDDCVRRIDKALALLREIEWLECEGEDHCPVCGHNKIYGHLPDCRLTAALEGR